MGSYRITGIALAIASKLLYAGTMGSVDFLPVCVPGTSIIPCATNAWEISAAALYLQPNYDSKIIYLGNINTELLAERITKDSSNWDWGFQLAAAYHFGTGNDLNINWYHFDQAMTNTTNLDALPLNLSAPVTYTFKPEWDEVNLALGQIIDYGVNKSFRFYGGLQYTRLASEVDLSLPPLVIKNIIRNISANGELKFHGVGPQLGIDFYSDLLNGFGLYANAAITILFGNGRFQQTSFVNNTPLNYKSGSKELVVPEFEGKAGVQFNYIMRQSYLSLQAGYMLVDFFSGTKTLSQGFGSVFSLNGAYFGAKWVSSI
ncbi:Lpg1974 family pore-forming outer membrane protein (plasmid) [Legionella sp. D16C41]|uniref:Lpg1974 family pore-forming outer membrane protein n=1 Tax=Legionella sp. D16C41 TaxID=3402688 RepID=UPI003AF9E67A